MVIDRRTVVFRKGAKVKVNQATIVGRGETGCWARASIKGKLNVWMAVQHEWTEGTRDMRERQRSKPAGPSAETGPSCRAAGSWCGQWKILRVSRLTSQDLNFADKEEGKKKYGIFSEIGGRCPDDILGISPAEEGGKNGDKTIRKLFMRCLYTKWTRNWSHRTMHECRFHKRASRVRLHCLTNPGLRSHKRYFTPAAILSQGLSSTQFRRPF